MPTHFDHHNTNNPFLTAGRALTYATVLAHAARELDGSAAGVAGTPGEQPIDFFAPAFLLAALRELRSQIPDCRVRVVTTDQEENSRIQLLFAPDALQVRNLPAGGFVSFGMDFLQTLLPLMFARHEHGASLHPVWATQIAALADGWTMPDEARRVALVRELYEAIRPALREIDTPSDAIWAGTVDYLHRAHDELQSMMRQYNEAALRG